MTIQSLDIQLLLLINLGAENPLFDVLMLAMKWRLFPIILASLIAFSRLYLGVHYPTDVLAGALLGSMIGLVLSMLYQVIGTKAFMKRKR